MTTVSEVASALLWSGSLSLCLPTQNLLCWDVKKAQAPLLIRSFSSCHRDWITGCAWTKDKVLVSEGRGEAEPSKQPGGKPSPVHALSSVFWAHSICWFDMRSILLITAMALHSAL